MDVTIAICTHNRREELHHTLNALRVLPGHDCPAFEIVVIDNASTDGTAESLTSWRLDGVDTRVVHEPAIGLWRARNRAIAEARGAYLLFLDDDVTVSDGLLAAYAAAIRAHPTAPFLGGPIIPVLEQPPTPLALAIAERRPGVYSQLDLGPDVLPLGPNDGPWGANCCIQMAAIGAERFDPRFGYSGKETVSGDETEFLVRLYKRYGPGVWVPGARVEHRIAASRGTLEFVQRSAYGTGRAKVRLAALHGGGMLALSRMFVSTTWHAWQAARQHRAISTNTALGDQVDLQFKHWHERGKADELRRVLWSRFPVRQPAEQQ